MEDPMQTEKKRGEMVKETKTSKKTMLILAGILLGSCLCIFYKYIFGDQVLCFTDIGSDTYDQYLMQYQTIIHHLREGSFSFWDFNNGFGMNMFALNMFDPFLILLYLIGVLAGPSAIYSMLVYIQILRILLAGISVYCFLSCFPLSEKSKLMASYVYALCGFMIVWGQHYQFGTILMVLPALLLAAEKAMKKPRWFLGLTLFCTVSSVISFYMSYMQFIILGMYILFRTAWNSRIFSRDGMKFIGRAYGSMILGIGMGAFSLVPNMAMIVGVSGRVGGGSFLDTIIESIRLWPEDYYKVLISRFFSSNLQGINNYRGMSNYYEDPNVFLSVLFLLLAVQAVYFYFKRSYTVRQRVILAVAAVSFAFMLLVPLGSLPFNGFAYPFSRHTFLLMPFFVWLMADIMDEMLEKNRISIVLWGLSMIVIFVVYQRSFAQAEALQDLSTMKLAAGLKYLAVLIGVFLFCAAFFKKKQIQTVSTVGLLLSVMATMSLDGYYAYNVQRTILAKAPSDYMDQMYDPDVEEALRYLEENDPSFYRVDKDYTIGTATSCLNSLAQNYAGVSTYNSTQNTNIQQFVSSFWPNLEIINYAHYSYANGANDEFPAALSHVKYVISRNPDYTVNGFELYHKVNDIYIYKNTTTGEMAKFYTNVYGTQTYEGVKEGIDQEKLLSEAVLCDTIPENYQKPITDYGKVPAAGEEQIQVIPEAGTGVILRFPDVERQEGEKLVLEFALRYSRNIPEVTVTAGTHSMEKVVYTTSTPIQVSVPAGTDQILISHPAEDISAELIVEHPALYRTPVKDLHSLSQGITVEACKKDSRIQGTAQVEENGVLMLPVPYEKGWEASVDGEKAQIHQVDYGFSGIELEEGKHEISLVYRAPGFRIGVFISIFLMILTISLWSFIFVKKKISCPFMGNIV